MGILEQLGDVVCLLVADHLLHGLIHGNMGCFALNDRERNAVDKQNNVRAGIVKLILAFYSEFFRHMEQVVFRMLPVDVFQIEAEGLSAAHSFRVAFAQQQSIVDLLAGAHQTVGQRFVQLLHGPLDIGSGEFVFRAGIAVAVQPAQLSPEDIF